MIVLRLFWLSPTLPALCWLVLLGSGVVRAQELPWQRPTEFPQLSHDVISLPPSSQPYEEDAVSTVDEEWWWSALEAPLLRFEHHKLVALDEAKLATVEGSPELAAMRARWAASDQEVLRQQSRFDSMLIVNSLWRSDNVPVGSALDGALARQETTNLTTQGGLAKANPLGGQLQATQDFGFRDSNSQFFNPTNQGSARLALTYSQPLLRGAGRMYNNAPIHLAALDRQLITEQTSGVIQEVVLNATLAYWDLVRVRASFLIMARSHARAEEVVSRLEIRQDLDASRRQIVRARGEAASRSARLTAAEYDVAIAQERLIRSMLGAGYANTHELEWIPLATVQSMSIAIPELNAAVELAIRRRPEIHAAANRVAATAKRLQLAKNETRPQLDLELGGYVAGLRGDYDADGAWVDQFGVGRPSYSAGLAFERPVGNRAALAAEKRLAFETVTRREELRTLLANVALEVRGQVLAEFQAAASIEHLREAVKLAAEDLEVSMTRLELLADGGNVARLYLDDLLQTQARLEAAELSLMNARVQHATATARRQFATAVMLSDATAD